MKTLIIINERAGGHQARTVERTLKDELRHYPAERRASVEILVTSEPERAHELIEANAHELERVIAAGGDGTITQTISWILPYPQITLGIIPLGTGNRLASNLGIPSHIKGALEVALGSTVQQLDIGCVNGRYFSLMAGAGMDAQIIEDVKPEEKRLMGMFAYIYRAVLRAFRYRYAVFEIDVDGQPFRTRGIGVIVANARNLIGDYFSLTPKAHYNDGLLDVCVLTASRKRDYITSLIEVLLQSAEGETKNNKIRHFRGKKITIRSRPKLQAQADGDLIGHTPLEIEALHNAIGIHVPKDLKNRNVISQSVQQLVEHVRLTLMDLFQV